MKISKVEPLELAFTTSDRKKYFAFSEMLKNKTITALNTFNAAQVTGTSKEATIISEADAKKAFLVLVPQNEGKETINIPLYMLNTAYNDGRITEIDADIIDWQKSYIYTNATISASSIPLFAHYR
ncbi:MAG: hypothetical protein ACOYLE_10905 [Bacteroidales bacterium]